MHWHDLTWQCHVWTVHASKDSKAIVYCCSSYVSSRHLYILKLTVFRFLNLFCELTACHSSFIQHRDEDCLRQFCRMDMVSNGFALRWLILFHNLMYVTKKTTETNKKGEEKLSLWQNLNSLSINLEFRFCIESKDKKLDHGNFVLFQLVI